MSHADMLQLFTEKAEAAGASVATLDSSEAIASYISGKIDGPLLLPELPDSIELNLADTFTAAGLEVISKDLRSQAASADGGITGVDFAIAETGTLVLESTPEDIRLASTLPAKHFALLHPNTIVADGMDAVPLLRKLNEQHPASYLAYITGPSRTADIERVLTIGVHGPKELHILICDQCGGES